MTTAAIDSRSTAIAATRWSQLICCIFCMILIANLQYGWTLFVNPINKAHGWSIASIQLTFSIFIALETWLTPIHGTIVDSLGGRRGAKVVVALGESWLLSVGLSMRTRNPSKCCISVLWSAALEAGRCTRRVSVRPSSGFPTGAAWPWVFLRRVTAPARR